MELLGPEKQLLSYYITIQNILMTLLAGSQVSNLCHLDYLFQDKAFEWTANKTVKKFKDVGLISVPFIIEPRHEKTNILHMRKQKRRSGSR